MMKTLLVNFIFQRLLKRTMSKKVNYPSAARSKVFILEIMRKYIDAEIPAKMLEISSGTGQQAVYYVSNFPKLTIHTSEFDENMFESIRAYAEEVPNGRVKNPVKIDASQGPWDNVDSDYDYILNVNMFHVTPLSCSIGFFKYGSQVLKNNGLIFTYGAMMIDGVIEPQSNVDFDTEIRQRDPRCGLRDINDLKKIAEENGINFLKMYDMPANNKMCVWKKNNQ